MKKFILFILLCHTFLINAQTTANNKQQTSNQIIPGAYRIQVYLPYLKNKKVAVFANQTSVIGNTHLVDTLQKLGVNIVKIFSPEHGFRGAVDAGESVESYIDKQTGIKVISLYGKKLKPSVEDLNDVDILIFDIQDVGVRFYTYISSLQNFIEAAVENSKPLFILDRPNPNGFYVDGPVLDTAYKSFVGMQPVPVVYGMTIGEYAMMIAGENWLSKKANERYNYYRTAKATADTPIHFVVIKCANYTHKNKYVLPVKPSPNLPFVSSVYWYPSTCFFEGTIISEGRGTEKPFEIFGHPKLPDSLYKFIPHSTEGAKDPKFKDQICYGWNISNETPSNKIELQWLLNAYKLFPDKDSFFIKPKSNNPKNYFFNKLSGNDELMLQIIEGKSEKEIRESWQPKLDTFKKIRKKYLLYPDFE
ncbi:MAG: exo-beta-N-acetylmuramidase NamZ family protein [Chitinophagaceae bacterium]